jgi:hypothetical protein
MDGAWLLFDHAYKNNVNSIYGLATTNLAKKGSTYAHVIYCIVLYYGRPVKTKYSHEKQDLANQSACVVYYSVM